MPFSFFICIYIKTTSSKDYFLSKDPQGKVTDFLFPHDKMLKIMFACRHWKIQRLSYMNDSIVKNTKVWTTGFRDPESEQLSLTFHSQTLTFTQHKNSPKTLQKLYLSAKVPHQEIRWNYGIYAVFRGGSRTAATSKMERFVIKVNGF